MAKLNACDCTFVCAFIICFAINAIELNFDSGIGGVRWADRRDATVPDARCPCPVCIADTCACAQCIYDHMRHRNKSADKNEQKDERKKMAEMELQHTEQQAQHIQLGIEKLCVIHITSWCWILLNGYITNIAYNILLAGMVLGCCPVSKRDRDDHAMRTTHTIFLL